PRAPTALTSHSHATSPKHPAIHAPCVGVPTAMEPDEPSRTYLSTRRVQGSPGKSEESDHMVMAGRRDWVQPDLRCLMGGRIIGRLVGPLPAGDPTKHTLAGRLPQFSAFRPADAGVPAVRLVGGEQFRCTTCGGAVIMDEL